MVPPAEFRKVFWSSRFTLFVHLAVIALAIVIHSWLPILLGTATTVVFVGLVAGAWYANLGYASLPLASSLCAIDL